ncbi:MAG: rRNA pseudouridine synthase [Thermoanaerobacteraceae bacterium]|nr:rRNA pseudouridine synthase [Thermoanaerobacteraceae bacterium]
MRLQKYLSQAGIASRRAGENLILQGRIKVNGITIKELGTKVNPESDIIEVDGRICDIKRDFIYILLNKPKGILTSVKDPFGRPTVLELLKGVKEKVFPVGRLDKDTEGLLLLTNDGDLTYKLTHPKFKVFKTYIANVNGAIKQREIRALEKGIMLEDGLTSPAKIKIMKVFDNSTLIELKIYEGRKRQIRRMCAAIGHPVISLRRTQIGCLSLKGLKLGQWRYLNREEINYIKSLKESEVIDHNKKSSHR